MLERLQNLALKLSDVIVPLVERWQDYNRRHPD
jgi:hypothetical protein